ncbi:hypothetical protein KBC04_03060 [Candidatus Babeliales bacterium]|nr:hypothetical protein [Candidatus Babeliales bacterium]MBP9843968.1 hypothetical protein [Candidatus Babeliales bacterium]
MKFIKKISTFIILCTMNQITYLEALPANNIAAQARITNNGPAKAIQNNSTTEKVVVGNAVQNNQAIPAVVAVTPAVTVAAENQNNTATPIATPTEEPQAQVTTVSSPAPTQQSNDAAQNTPAPVEPQSTPSAPVSESPVVEQTSQQPEQAVQTTPVINPEAEKTTLIEENKKTIVQDQDQILKTLKTIEVQNNQTQARFSESAMDQLFNNFVYFKNFIVENFTKENMLHLCVEFIDQIYPKQTVAAAPNLIKETSQVQQNQPVTNSNSSQEENIMNQSSSPEESEQTEDQNQSESGNEEQSTSSQEDQESTEE